jgi:MoxR-like ATPase
MDLQDIRNVAENLRTEVRKAIVGQDEVVELMLTSLLVGGHVLLEGVPGRPRGRSSPSFCWPMRSTAPHPRRRPRCSSR